MGTTLTGTTPQDTYDSLIKVTDNGPLSGTAKYLSDGLGNDSALAVSTANIGIGTNNPDRKLTVHNAASSVIANFRYTAGGFSSIILSNTTGQAAIASIGNDLALSPSNAERVRITSTGRVGIGTTNPAYLTQLKQTSAGFMHVLNRPNTDIEGLLLGVDSSDNGQIASNNTALIFGTTITGTFNERMRMLAGGGLTFNGDTAAANALDDYEEGTFTATLTPSTSGAIGGNPTFTTWTYTKIGRKVTINGVFVVNGVSSPVGTSIIVSGLPFTILNNNGAYGGFSCTYFAFSTSINTSEPARHTVNTTSLIISKDASTVALNDEIYVTATYFV